MNAAPTPYGWLQPLAADAGLAEPLALTAPEQRVGRTELKTSRKLVSKAHAILAHSAAGAATVEDRSVNGTYLNGACVGGVPPPSHAVLAAATAVGHIAPALLPPTPAFSTAAARKEKLKSEASPPSAVNWAITTVAEMVTA